MSKLSRTKGANYERDLGHKLSEAFNEKVERNLTQTRDGGHDLLVDPFIFEAKIRKEIAVCKWYEQVVAAANPEQIPVVIFRQNRGQDMCLISLQHLLPMLELWRRRNPVAL